MTLSPAEARDALDNIADTEKRASIARGARRSSPHLIMWGAIWMIGYVIDGIGSVRTINIAWLALVVLGVAGGILMSRQQKSHFTAALRIGCWLVPLLFIAATYVVMQPTRLIQFEVFPALCVALGYAVVGIIGNPYYLGLAAVEFALTMGGYFFLQPIFPFWMAACGGGSLVVAGLWFGQF